MVVINHKKISFAFTSTKSIIVLPSTYSFACVCSLVKKNTNCVTVKDVCDVIFLTELVPVLPRTACTIAFLTFTLEYNYVVV